VFYGEAFGSSIRETLVAAGVRVHTARHRPKTHQKLLIVQGGYGGNANAGFVWTGSHNWTPGALKIDDMVFRVSTPAFVNRYVSVFNWTWMHA
jgi:phosphatidylserine/phosphatidylglycerophosphate/cardiolipin synthase-like enzyme